MNTPETPPEPTAEETPLDPEKLAQLVSEIESEQSLPMAIVAGIITSIVGASIWATITVVTEYQIGWMAIGVGLLVGFGVKKMGKGISPTFGYIGGAFSLLGCGLGNFLTIVGFVSAQESIGIFEVLRTLDYSIIPEIMADTFGAMDILFYGLAIYQGYKFSFREISEEELIAKTG